MTAIERRYPMWREVTAGLVGLAFAEITTTSLLAHYLGARWALALCYVPTPFGLAYLAWQHPRIARLTVALRAEWAAWRAKTSGVPKTPLDSSLATMEWYAYHLTLLLLLVPGVLSHVAALALIVTARVNRHRAERGDWGVVWGYSDHAILAQPPADAARARRGWLTVVLCALGGMAEGATTIGIAVKLGVCWSLALWLVPAVVGIPFWLRITTPYDLFGKGAAGFAVIMKSEEPAMRAVRVAWGRFVSVPPLLLAPGILTHVLAWSCLILVLCNPLPPLPPAPGDDGAPMCEEPSAPTPA